MKKKILSKILMVVMTASVLLTGCGEQETSSSGESIKDEKQDAAKISGIRVTDGAKYQYQPVNLKDIIVEYSGLKGDKPLSKYDGEYLLDSDVYLGGTVGLYLDGEHYEAEVEDYMPYSDIVWEVIDNMEFWDVTDYDAKEIDPSLFRGVIEYSDGSKYEVTPERVRGTGVSENMRFHVSISYRGVDYEGSVTDIHPDGEYLGEGEEPDYTGTVEVRVKDTKDSVVMNTEGLTEDISLYRAYRNIELMDEIYKMWLDCLEYTDKDEVNKDAGEHPELYAGKDTYYTWKIKKDSLWESAYGDGGLPEAYAMRGLLDYGVYGVCKCKEMEGDIYDMVLDYCGTPKDMFDYDGVRHNLIMAMSRLSNHLSAHSLHVMKNTSMETLRTYIVAEYMYRNRHYTNLREYDIETTPYAGNTGYYTDNFLLALYGFTAQDVVDKFMIFEGYRDALEKWGVSTVARVWYGCTISSGYEGSVFDFYSEDIDVLRDYITRGIVAEYDARDWKDLSEGEVSFISSFGIQIPDYATYKVEESAE